jgi:hypothetical protein
MKIPGAFFVAILFCILFCCKEKSMRNDEVFPPIAVAIPFTYNAIHHLFPVLKENSVGVVYGETWAIITSSDNQKINLDVFPDEIFKCPTCKALPQIEISSLYVQSPKSVILLQWQDKKLSAEFMDFSKSTGIGIYKSKIVDYQKGISLSVFYHDDENMDFHYYFVIDDILSKKRLKEIPIPQHESPLDVVMTPSFAFYRYVWKNCESPWVALDNNLEIAAHPLCGLLNDSMSTKVFYASGDNTYVSEEMKHAFIIAYNQALKRDLLYLARWYGNPQIIPIPIDSSATAGERRLLKSPNSNTMSPSGRWVYFATDGGAHLQDTHYLVYLDPALPNGFLPPFKLGIEGNVEQASWMTTPEGLVLYKDDSLLYFDLSNFKPQDYAPAK